MAEQNSSGNSKPPPQMVMVEADLVGNSPLSFSRPIQTRKPADELHDDFEQRTWRERIHSDANGEAFIPAGAIKNALVDVAKFLAESIKGKGKATWTKHFKSGIMVTENLMLGIQADTIEGEVLFVPSDGRPGSGSRVYKTFPTIQTWRTHVSIHVFDAMLAAKPEKVEEYLERAGKLIGLLRWRPANNGLYGRFSVENFKATVVK